MTLSLYCRDCGGVVARRRTHVKDADCAHGILSAGYEHAWSRRKADHPCAHCLIAADAKRHSAAVHPGAHTSYLLINPPEPVPCKTFLRH